MTSEANVQAAIRLAAADEGWMLWRNNVGACSDARGRVIRYGLGNDSSAVNARYKSSDLIGIRPVTITHDDVGRTIGQFIAIECKSSTWRGVVTEHELAQERYLNLVRSYGGGAQFMTHSNILL